MVVEKRVMADYLQPGGARTKFTKEEKQGFLVRVKNLNKSIISKCLVDNLTLTTDHSIIAVRVNLIANRKRFLIWKHC